MRFDLAIDELHQQRESARQEAYTGASILCVDDERNILATLRTLLGKFYEVHEADNGSKAMELLKQNDYAVIISDQRMPDMLGTDLLARAKEESPFTVRILLTAYTDVNDVIESINSSGVHHFIVKPWDPDNMLLLLKNAVEMSELQRSNADLVASLTEANEALASLVDEKAKDLSHAMQAKLLKARKLSSLGQMVTAMKNEIRNSCSILAESNGVIVEAIAQLEEILTNKPADNSLAGQLLDNLIPRFSKSQVLLSDSKGASDQLKELSGSLSICYEIVKGHRGKLTFDREEGETNLVIHLPLTTTPNEVP